MVSEIFYTYIKYSLILISFEVIILCLDKVIQLIIICILLIIIFFLTDNKYIKTRNNIQNIYSQNICSICRNNLNNESYKCIQLYCYHIYHENCLKEWADYNRTCPNCKTIF